MNIKIIKNTIDIGVDKPVKFLHITDSHITRDDPTELNRTAFFDTDYDGCAEDYFFQALKYAKENNIPILHTGDLIDFFTEANFSFIDTYFNECDYMYAAGNHDFCHFLGKATEDYQYKWTQIKKIAPHIRSNLYFDSRVTGGINIVTLDDSYYLISEGQLELLKAEVAKGYPIILAMHVPLYTPALSDAVMAIGNPCAYALGAPSDALSAYPKDRMIQQTPDEATLKAIDYIKSEPLIKALVTGHVHLNFEEQICDGMCQYATHGSFAGYVREFTII